jgi:hypothetical protein
MFLQRAFRQSHRKQRLLRKRSFPQRRAQTLRCYFRLSVQASFMAEHTTIVANSVRAAEESAKASVKSIEVTVNKERARLRVEVQLFRAQDLAGLGRCEI